MDRTSVRKKICEILEELHDDIDFEREKKLVDDSLLYSFDLVSLAADLSEEFDVDITAREFVAENFNSLDSLTDMILRLTEKQ